VCTFQGGVGLLVRYSNILRLAGLLLLGGKQLKRAAPEPAGRVVA